MRNFRSLKGAPKTLNALPLYSGRVSGNCERTAGRAVAIIGSGPAGLSCARWLKREGFDPVLFEQGDRIGGQWSGTPGWSGVWPSLCTNTGRRMTEFSDLSHAPGTALYPGNRAMYGYLHGYAQEFGLLECVRLRTRVESLDRTDGGAWRLRLRYDHSLVQEERFERVVVGSGRFNKPSLPRIPGLESFSGRGGVIHAFNYRDAAPYRHMRVLVGGCAVSALEVASDLAMQGAKAVVCTNRRQRYVLPKNLAGVPIEEIIHTRHSALVRESRPLADVARELKSFIVERCGVPERYGALRPHDDLLVAGITQCQFFPPLVAEGRIGVRPWISCVEGDVVRFADGTSESFDALVFGTGFDLNLPFLGADLRQILGVREGRLDLHDFTFHPELDRLAFAGLFQVAGPYLPPIELQARWIAYSWSGARSLPPGNELRQRIDAERDDHAVQRVHHMPSVMLAFARNAGVEPVIDEWPELRQVLLYGPLLPIGFRISGRDSLIDAADRLSAAAATLPDWHPSRVAAIEPKRTPESSAFRAAAHAR